MHTPPSIIAIDGPAGSGKSTVGAALAAHLGYTYFDTGVMYRAVTWAALQQGVSMDDEPGVTQVAQTLHIDVLPPTVDDGRQYTVLADGHDITWAIREPDVNAHVSQVSKYRGVRNAMTPQQRRIASRGRIVMVGRDIGTVVLPDADLKIFLDATVEERAQRRWREEQARGLNRPFADVLADVRSRDKQDSQRDIAPLRPADDAVILDTTALPERAVIERVIALATPQDPSTD